MMHQNFDKKCSVREIRERFDKDVERFCNLEVMQLSIVDAPLAMDLITQAAVNATPRINRILDVGCGAGNCTLKFLQQRPNLNCDLLDLSMPMLEKAEERVTKQTCGDVRIIHSDLRTAKLEMERYDVVFAVGVLHYLREDAEWRTVFQRLYRSVRRGGSVWVADLVNHEQDAIARLMWRRYAEYLTGIGGKEYQKKVFDYIAFEDSPRSVTYQLDLLREAGFSDVDILHKNSCFAAFGGVKK